MAGGWDTWSREDQEAADEIAAWFNTLDHAVWLNVMVYFTAMSIAGVPFWRNAAITSVVALATKFHYGRRILSRMGVAIMIAVLVYWAEVLPAVKEWTLLIHTATAKFGVN